MSDWLRWIQILGAPIPSFTQRTISTLTESADGETWAVAGLLSEEDTRNLRQVPWISKVPIIGALFRSKEDTATRTELMITVTARTIDGVNKMTTSFETHGKYAKPAANAAGVSLPAMPEPKPPASHAETELHSGTGRSSALGTVQIRNPSQPIGH